MSWIEFHEALRDHWKIHRLSKRLNIPYPYALGLVANLWLWAVSNAPKGDLSGFTNDEILRAMMCQKVNLDVKKVLQECELLNDDMKIHDWKKHGVSYLVSHRKRQKRYRETLRHGDVTRTSPLRINQPDQPDQPDQPKKREARPPSLDDVKTFFGEKPGADAFFDHFESNGWKVGGRAPMKDWRAAARNWMRRQKNFEKPNQGGRYLTKAQQHNQECIDKVGEKYGHQDVPKSGNPDYRLLT